MAEIWRPQKLIRCGYRFDYIWRQWNIIENDEIFKFEIIKDLFLEPELIDGLMRENLWHHDPSPPQPRSRRMPRKMPRRSIRIARNQPRRSTRIKMKSI